MERLSTSRDVSALHWVTAAIAVLALGGCSSDAPSPPESTVASQAAGRVLFQGEGPSHLLVGMADLDGSDIEFPLSDLPGGNQTNPDWSPDGTRIVFAHDDGSRESLWVSDADGSNPTELLACRGSCSWLDDPDWSPDGSKIVYSRTESRGAAGWGSLEAVDVDTGHVSVILAPRVRTFMSGARWSPDGSEIAFESVHKVGVSINAEVDGVSLRIVAWGSKKPGKALTQPDLFAATADWSPDGGTIVYSGLARPDSEAADLFVISPDGGEPRQVTHVADAGGYADEPAWFGDSNAIVFSGRLADRSGSGVLLTVTADGTDEPTDMGSTQVIGRHPRVEPGA